MYPMAEAMGSFYIERSQIIHYEGTKGIYSRGHDSSFDHVFVLDLLLFNHYTFLYTHEFTC